jgi:hypothetical protein
LTDDKATSLHFAHFFLLYHVVLQLGHGCGGGVGLKTVAKLLKNAVIGLDSSSTTTAFDELEKGLLKAANLLLLVDGLLSAADELLRLRAAPIVVWLD